MKERVLLLLPVRETTSWDVSDEDRSVREATLSLSSSAKYDGWWVYRLMCQDSNFEVDTLTHW